MLARVLALARLSAHDEAARTHDAVTRDHLRLSVELLEAHASQLCARYPQALEAAFQRQPASEAQAGNFPTQALRLDQLERLDESQVQEHVETARAVQQVLLLAQAELTGFNTYVCALQGLAQVTASCNPMRPDVYVAVLQGLMCEMGWPTPVCGIWLQHVLPALGEALGAAYAQWVAQLQGQGVQPVVLSVHGAPDTVPTQPVGTSRPGRVVWSPQHRQTVLTLDLLRRLMTGELLAAPSDPKAALAREFAREFESEGTGRPFEADFAATVPAAFEALQEMQQLDHLVQRMAQRPDAALTGVPHGAACVRAQLRDQSDGLAQVLSLEVVALMVDNLVQDSRLLVPVRDLIARLEPALLRLVLVDGRFFIDRQHPARCLLQEIVQRGLAFGSVEDVHFNAFLVSLQRFVSPLATAQIDSADPFVRALKSLTDAWCQAAAQMDLMGHKDSAVAMLEFAEARNLLAEKMVTGMQSLAALAQVPQSLLDFLFGPWAQVMATAELKDATRSDDPGHYKALVSTLLWSAQPELTRKNIDKLTKLVPRLLSGLREGLRLIDYPPIKTSVFFDVLMQLHQQAFRRVPSQPVVTGRAGLPATLLGDQTHWMAPAEARVSGFMAFPDVPVDQVEPSAPASPAFTQASLVSAGGGLDALSVGTWVELQFKEAWMCTQLSWISPQRTMYLFTSVQGKIQSMTQRMLERMHGSGALRVLSAQSIVDGALDAVVQTAMRNSLDLRVA